MTTSDAGTAVARGSALAADGVAVLGNGAPGAGSGGGVAEPATALPGAVLPEAALIDGLARALAASFPGGGPRPIPGAGSVGEPGSRPEPAPGAARDAVSGAVPGDARDPSPVLRGGVDALHGPLPRLLGHEPRLVLPEVAPPVPTSRSRPGAGSFAGTGPVPGLGSGRDGGAAADVGRAPGTGWGPGVGLRPASRPGPDTDPGGFLRDPGASGYYFLSAAPAPVARSVEPSATEARWEGAGSRRIFDVRDVRRDFPILEERVHGRRLIWLDNAATTHKPRAVIDRLVHYYEHENSNVHRAAHTLAARSTDAYEGARQKMARFLGAGSPEEIVFVRGATEAVNLVAWTYGRRHVGEGDEIVLTTLEHHSNIVPWQLLAREVGASLRVVPVGDRGEILLDEYGKLLTSRTRMVALTHVSNALGTIVPVEEMIAAAHRHGVPVLVDGAQAVSHFPVDVQALDADFYVLSGHKMFGPTGVGVLYGKKALLDEMPPWQGGGNMIERVTFEHSTFAAPPARFEAGTATLADAVGLGAAAEYLERLGMANVSRHEHELLVHATQELRCIRGLHLVGTAPHKAGVVSFVVDGMAAEDVGRLLDQQGIAVRAGHHCAQPTMDRFGLTATVRPSLALYNTHEEIDALARALRLELRS